MPAVTARNLVIAIASLALLLPSTAYSFDLTRILIHTLEDSIGGQTSGFRFRAVVDEADGDITSLTLTTPANHTATLIRQSNNQFVFEQSFADLPTLRALFPTGEYTFDFNQGALTGTLPHYADLPSRTPKFEIPLDREVVALGDPILVFDDVNCPECFFGSLDLMEAHENHHMHAIYNDMGLPWPSSGQVISSIPLVADQRVYRFGVLLTGPYTFMTRLYTGFYDKAAIAGDVFDLGSGGIRENRVDVSVAAQRGGTTYYIDAQSGDDYNEGTNPFAPLKTLTAVNEIDLLPGDTVLLQRGRTWRGEALLLHESGSPYNYIRVGAYGEGAAPKIRPVEIYQDGWTNIGNNLYTQPSSRPASGDDFLGAVFENEARMQFVASLNELTQPGQAFWSDGLLYIRPSGDLHPNESGVTYRVAIVVAPNDTSLGVDLRGDFYIVEDLDIAYTGHYGIGQQYKTSRDNGFSIIRRNVVAHSFHDLIGFGLNGGTIEYNVVQNTQDFGIACLDVGASSTRDVIVRNNVVANCMIGLTPEGSVSNIRWLNNTVLWCDRGASAVSVVGVGDELRPIDNLFKDNLLAFNRIGILLGGQGANFGEGTKVEGNSILSSLEAAIAWAPASNSKVTAIRNNRIQATGRSAILIADEVDSLEISGNVIIDAREIGTAAIDVGPGALNIDILNNTLYNNNAGIVFRGDTQGNTLFGNIIANSAAFNLVMTLRDNVSNSSHNLYHGNYETGEGIVVEGANITIEQLQSIGLESESLFTEPFFTDPKDGDFSLTTASPAIDSSLDVGRQHDLEGNPMHDVPEIPNTGEGSRAFIDRGAIEFTP